VLTQNKVTIFVKLFNNIYEIVTVHGTLKLEIGNWKFGLHAFVLFFPISSFKFQVSSFKP